jgi:hypothetical protein
MYREVCMTNNNGFWISWLDLLGASVTITSNHNSPHIELLLNDVCLTNLSEESRTNVPLIWISHRARIHECTACYNCHEAGIEVTMLNSCSVLLCCHGNAFVNIHCHGNKCLPSRCLAKMTSASAIIPAFRQCLLSRCLANGHIPSQSVGLLGRGSGRRRAAIYTGQHKHRINPDRHPCLECDSNPWPQCLRLARPLWWGSNRSTLIRAWLSGQLKVLKGAVLLHRQSSNSARLCFFVMFARGNKLHVHRITLSPSLRASGLQSAYEVI